jgi:hypothetical protein
MLGKNTRKVDMNSNERHLDLRPEIALSQKKMSGMILLCFENERPMKGMLGYLDWRFNGHFSKLLKDQIITGQKNETVYVPFSWNDQTYQFLIVGAGPLPDHGNRPSFSKLLLDSALKKVDELKLTDMGISALDWSLNQEVPNLWILN